jgi:hypothetical protein
MEIRVAVNYHGFRDAMSDLDSNRTAEWTMAKASQRQSREIQRRLQEFYDLGKRVVADDEANPNRGTYSRGVVQKHADQLGVSSDTITKARHFAITYTQQDFQELAAARTPDGMPMGVAHVTLLLHVKNRTQRKALQKKALREGWSFEELRQAIRSRSPRKGHGGRRPAPPPTVAAALLQIDEMANAWSRWYKDLASAHEGEVDRKAVALADLPENVRRVLQATVKQIKRLRAELETVQKPKGKSG